jgi:hypothetical protein
MRLAVSPGDFPPWQTVYGYFAAWRDDGTLAWLHAGLLLDVVITAASVQDRDAARPLLWNLHRACPRSPTPAQARPGSSAMRSLSSTAIPRPPGGAARSTGRSRCGCRWMCQGQKRPYLRRGKPAKQKALTSGDDYTIVATYGTIYRGIVQYRPSGPRP